ncbi:MAG TPA: tetratricopeptide repeat protein [Sandaracinaceae bacterium]
MFRSTTCTCFLLALAALSPAHAQPSDDARARQLYLEGDRHYQEGRYEEAVSAFQESYRLSGRPLLLFNLANAYERLGRYGDALDALREYLPHAPPDEQELIRARIASLEQRSAPTPAPDPVTAPPSGDASLLTAGIAVGGAGLVLSVSGIVFGALALDARGRAQAACVTLDGTTLCDRSARDALEQDAVFAALADVGIVVGIAAIAAGAVLTFLGATSTGSESAALLPWIAPRADGGEAGVAVAF